MNVETINVRHLLPEGKDYERALGLCYSTDPGIPDYKKALRMANAIKDPMKLIRRSKAVVGVWGKDPIGVGGVTPWMPFKLALISMGFTEIQVYSIELFEIDEENL